MGQLARLRCFCSLEEGSRERLAGCVSFVIGEGKWDKFPDLTFSQEAGRFWSRWAYLEVAEANDLFEIPPSFPVKHSGWAQEELAGAGMEPLLERVEMMYDAGLRASSIVREYVAQRLAPLQEHIRPM